MPKLIQSVQCAHCSTLIDITDKYVVAEVLDAHVKEASDASAWDVDHAPKLKATDIAFCNANCACNYVAARLSQVTR